MSFLFVQIFAIKKPLYYTEVINVGEKIRTPDLLVRSQTLYPAELRPHIKETLHSNVSLNAANRNRTGTGV